MGNLKVTLYDIFGYLVPGILFSEALLLLLWPLQFPQSPLTLIPEGRGMIALSLLFAYLAGHVLQAIGNALNRTPLGIKDEDVINELPKPLLTALISKLSTITGIPAADLSQSTLYQLSDEVLVQYGKTDNREVYVYREGFYRGTFVSSFLVAISLLLRASCSSLALDLGSTAPIIFQSILLLVAGLFLLFSFLFYGRYRRFAAYRVRAAILAALLSADRLPRSGGNVQ